MKKIAIAGLFDFYMYEEACAEVLEKKGYEVIRVPFGKLAKSKLGKAEFHFTFRFLVSFYYSCKLCWVIKNNKPDVLLTWRTTWLFDWALKYAKHKKATLVTYNNDDPFSPNYTNGNLHQRRLWKHFIRQIPLYDICLVYRPINIQEYKNVGGKNVHLWLPAYIPWEIDGAPPAFEGKPIDVIFIGHWEKHREEAIQYLINNGIEVEIYGHGWKHTNIPSNHNRSLLGGEYFGYLKSSKIALAFLSKLNRDEYTRRSFEIPACKTLMLSEKTPFLEALFDKNECVKFFSTKEEALEQVKYMLAKYQTIDRSSFISEDHSIHARVRAFLALLQKNKTHVI